VYLAFTENPRCIRPGQAYSSALVAGAFPHSPSRCSDWQGSSPQAFIRYWGLRMPAEREINSIKINRLSASGEHPRIVKSRWRVKLPS
jgi:hypothetical protein